MGGTGGRGLLATGLARAVVGTRSCSRLRLSGASAPPPKWVRDRGVCGVGRSTGREPDAGGGSWLSGRAPTRARTTLLPLDSEVEAGPEKVVVELPGSLPRSPPCAAHAQRLETRPRPRPGRTRKILAPHLFAGLGVCCCLLDGRRH